MNVIETVQVVRVKTLLFPNNKGHTSYHINNDVMI